MAYRRRRSRRGRSRRRMRRGAVRGLRVGFRM